MRSTLRCSGCGATVTGPYPFRCPSADSADGADHVLARALVLDGLRWPRAEDANPLVRFRTLLHGYDWATGHGLADQRWCELAAGLDEAIAAVSDARMAITPCERSRRLSDRLAPTGGVWVKNETGNPGGSHKVRHLAGTMLHLRAVRETGVAPPRGPLAIASCGNAARAAAIVAAAVGERLRVFVPDWADPGVTARLAGYGAEVVVCPRRAGEAGDPCVRRFREAVAAGAVPFGCQGPDNALALDSGRTLAWELASQCRDLDRIFVQVGGGALASSLAQGLEETVALGAMDRLPAIHTVQTEGGFPLVRAYEGVSARAGDSVEPALAYAARHRREFMWPWESPPASIATGILDDEVYDWFAIVRAMLRTGGTPIVVTENELRVAHALGLDECAAVTPTGTAGLAGLLAAVEAGVVGEGEHVAIIFTG